MNLHSTLVRRLLAAGSAGLLTVALAGALAPGAAALDRPNALSLPQSWLPEGIATVGSTAYLGSRADGDLLSLDLKTGQWDVFSQGPGTPSVGLKARDGLLYVAGGSSGTGRIVDIATGDILEELTFTTSTSFVNDVVLTDDAAWFTDSAQPQLYRVSLSDWSVSTLQLGGEWEQGTSTSANGISSTPDGSALLVVNSFNGTLYRVDPATGEATGVDTGGHVLTNGDGLLRHGRTLYVVQNRVEKVAVLRLGSDGTSAELISEIESDLFEVPTTVARWGQRLYLPNAQFGLPQTDFEVVWVNSP